MAPPPHSPRRRAPELMDDVVHEILLCLPPSSSADLVRASLVCKSWRRILSDPTFLRRYRTLHRPPLPHLGFLSYGDRSHRTVFQDTMLMDTTVLEGDALYVYAWSWPQFGWAQWAVVDLKALLPASAVSFAPTTFSLPDGTGTIFMTTDVGMFELELS